ncbi:MAG: hypothetical protein RLZZ308_748 [Candidatus Parcubacteria bacterium]|jgi:hypothetical protein
MTAFTFDAVVSVVAQHSANNAGSVAVEQQQKDRSAMGTETTNRLDMEV